MILRAIAVALAVLGVCEIASPTSARADDAGGVLPSFGARAPREAWVRPPGLPTDDALVAAGARIGAVRIQAQPIFDTTNPQENTSLFRLANRLHLRTREATIADQLLFRTGDPYEPRLLQETARILRTTRYLHDADVRPVRAANGVVDIEVLSRDVWTLNPGVSFGRSGGQNTSGFEIEELNLLGLGTALSASHKSGVDRSSNTLFYDDRQLFGTWWSLGAKYASNSDGRRSDLSLEHPFYALDTRWAAGFTVNDDERVDTLYDRGKVVDRFATHERRARAYVGRSRGLRNGWVTRWTTGLAFQESRFGVAVNDPVATVQVPPDRKLAYPWIAMEVLADEFQTARNRNQIERTEDVRLGLRLHAEIGATSASLGSDRSSVLFDLSAGKGFRTTDRQTIELSAAASGRWEGGAAANMVLGAAARYYLRHSPRRLSFLSVSVDTASNLDLDKQLLLGGDNGLRGYPLRYQGGEGRWLFTAEQRFYTNWYPFRLFNVGGAVFYDMGGTWGNNLRGTRAQGILKDIGVGLRLGNSRSARGNVLHFDVAVPLDGDRSIKSVQFLVQTKRAY